MSLITGRKKTRYPDFVSLASSQTSVEHAASLSSISFKAKPWRRIRQHSVFLTFVHKPRLSNCSRHSFASQFLFNLSYINFSFENNQLKNFIHSMMEYIYSCVSSYHSSLQCFYHMEAIHSSKSIETVYSSTLVYIYRGGERCEINMREIDVRKSGAKYF